METSSGPWQVMFALWASSINVHVQNIIKLLPWITQVLFGFPTVLPRTKPLHFFSHALKVEVLCQHYFPLGVFNQKYATNLSHFSNKETGFIVLTLYAFNTGIVAMRTDR